MLFSIFATAQSTESMDVVLATTTPRHSIKKVKYSFDVSLIEKQIEHKTQNKINGALISIFNNTTGQSEVTDKRIANSNFDFTFSEGNHYTLTIQKDGFKTKTLEAFVKTEGCLLCFEGLNMIENANTSNGVILANVEMIRK